MVTAFLVPDLVSLRSEFNELAPTRDKESDGWIGDQAHQEEPSDHNVFGVGNTGRPPGVGTVGGVHAIDVDKDLFRVDWTMERAVQIILDRHQRGLDDRLDYVIFNRRIWGAPNWTERAYVGPNPHDKHAHFSSRYEVSKENDDRPWGLLEDDMPSADEIAMATAKKINDDLRNPETGLYTSVPDRVKAGVLSADIPTLVKTGYVAFMWDAVHAARQDDYYKAASDSEKRRMRNCLDLHDELVRHALGAAAK